MMAQAVPPELMARNVTIICANPAGETHSTLTGWDADNPYFDGKGEIPRLFCEGGFAGATKWLVKHYLAELKPNGGGSVKDQVNRLEERVDQIYLLLCEKK